MTKRGSYKEWAVFPSGNTSYYKIIMEYTMGCATGGCSDWDYTTRLSLLHDTGPYELARVITPYGKGLDKKWEHTFKFDVTDYYPLMKDKDSVQIEVFYHGWSSGFSATVMFYMIEGTSPREVISIQNLYRGNWKYTDADQFNTQRLPAKTINLNRATKMVNIRVNISGHGFVNALNCAEFCKKDYYIKSEGRTIYTQAIWRDDCGLNAIFPQAGTWLYDRANWCPGDKAIIYNHNMTNYIKNGQLNIDMDIEKYSYTVPPGETPAYYIISVQLIEYKNPHHQVDVELEDIIYPSPTDENKRFNPVCGKAAIKIRNKGATSLANCQVIYGIHGADVLTYNWMGNLGFMESEIVELPMGHDSSWISWHQSTDFYAKLENLNGSSLDEVPFNNYKELNFEPVPQYPARMIFSLKTNNAAHETYWSLGKADGKPTVIASGDNLANATTYTEKFNLPNGCYVLTIGDRDKDGLSYFANNDGDGSVSLRNDGGLFFYKNLQSNFGTELKKHFTVGYGIGLPEYSENTFDFIIFPNPTTNYTELEIPSEPGLVNITICDLSGKAVYQFSKYIRESVCRHRLELDNFSSGLYQIIVSNGSSQKTKKLIIQ